MVIVLIKRKLAGMYKENELLVKINNLLNGKRENEMLKSGIED